MMIAICRKNGVIKGDKMEDITITQTRTGNPVWVMDDLGFRIRVDIKERSGNNTVQIRINHKDINAKEIRGKDVVNIHELYLTSVSEDNYETFCKDLVIMIRMLAKQGLSNHEIGEAIFNEYNVRHNKKDNTDIHSRFMELDKKLQIKLSELNTILKEIDNLSKEMGDIIDSL